MRFIIFPHTKDNHFIKKSIMKALFLRAILVLLFTFGYGVASAQVSYGYDASGNRIYSSITLTKSSVVNSSDSITKPSTELLDNLEIKIYPNPTKGQLTVDVSGLNEGENRTACIYSLRFT